MNEKINMNNNLINIANIYYNNNNKRVSEIIKVKLSKIKYMHHLLYITI